jgi:hypothetical protein
MPTLRESTTGQKSERSTLTALLDPLSPQWAFVAQLRQGTSFAPDQLHDRIEHLVSGQATTFASVEEVRAFMEYILARVREKPP